MAEVLKHIQAPWKYRPNEHDDWGRVVGSDGLTICYARVSRFTPEEQQVHREKGTDPVEGIARLIAAAPDLLSVAKRILDRGYVSESIAEERAHHNELVSAIAKAEVRSD